MVTNCHKWSSEGPNRYGVHITIDAAELSPDRFEVVVLRSDDLEIADVKVNGLEAAEKAYQDSVRMYVRPAAEKKPTPGNMPGSGTT